MSNHPGRELAERPCRLVTVDVADDRGPAPASRMVRLMKNFTALVVSEMGLAVLIAALLCILATRGIEIRITGISILLGR